MKLLMFDLVFFVYEFFSEIIPFVVALFVFRRIAEKKGIESTKKLMFMKILFALYIVAVLSVTGAGSLYDAFNFNRLETDVNQINLIPFADGFGIFAVLNIVMLVPFGFMLPIMQRNNTNFFMVICSGFAFSMLIELSQLCNYRVTDVEDLITNTLGAVIGYALYKAVFRKKSKKTEYIRFEPIVYVIVMILGRFFLYNEWGMVRLIYN